MASAINYVIVEMVLKEDAEKKSVEKINIKRGLFAGFKVIGEDKTVLEQGMLSIQEAANSLHTVSLRVYNIVSIVVGYIHSAEHYYFLKSAEDQVLAFSKIRSFLGLLRDQKFTTPIDDDMIDVTKYEKVPDRALNALKPAVGATSSGVSGVGVGRSASDYQGVSNNRSNIYNPSARSAATSNYWEKKVAVCERKTKKPSIAFLKELRAKLKAIKDGDYEYEVPELADKKVRTRVVGAVSSREVGSEYNGYNEY